LWLKEGDACTRFFHIYAIGRQRKNFVTHLKVDDVLLSEQADKAHVVDCFFDHPLGSAPKRGQFIDLYFLEAKFTEGEVWQVIKSQEQDKALGLDGFTGRFYTSVGQSSRPT
jgi:hypothetical protein